MAHKTVPFEVIVIWILQVGNPETEDYYDGKGLLEYAWGHTVISDELYNKAKQTCDFKIPGWSIECNIVMNQVFDKYDEIDIYNIYAPKCLINTTSSQARRSDRVNSLTKVIINPTNFTINLTNWCVI